MKKFTKKKFTKTQRIKILELLGYKNLEDMNGNEEYDEIELANAKHAYLSIEKALYDFEIYSNMKESGKYEKIHQKNKLLNKLNRNSKTIIQEVEKKSTLDIITKSNFKFEENSTKQSTLKSIKMMLETLKRVQFVLENEISITEEFIINNKKILTAGKRRQCLIVDISKVFRLFNCFSASNNQEYSYKTNIINRNQTNKEKDELRRKLEKDQLNLILYCLNILKKRGYPDANLTEKRLKEVIKEEKLEIIAL
ncbi:MAG: hypothetical protein N4A33_09360 [Bacteriovoracaceae bacterium]|jgi:hypothetical protein|nr:hypothetical protein [Bacteriovoracaceae bacterium]